MMNIGGCADNFPTYI